MLHSQIVQVAKISITITTPLQIGCRHTKRPVPLKGRALKPAVPPFLDALSWHPSRGCNVASKREIVLQDIIPFRSNSPGFGLLAAIRNPFQPVRIPLWRMSCPVERPGSSPFSSLVRTKPSYCVLKVVYELFYLLSIHDFFHCTRCCYKRPDRFSKRKGYLQSRCSPV